MAYLLNAANKMLYQSASSTKNYYANSQGQSITGTSNAETFWGHESYKVTLTGGAGDDTYYIKNLNNKVVELANGGVDTLTAWMNYTLPDNVENLNVSSKGIYGYGNSLDNIISGGEGSQTLNGLTGNDILKGGAGADTFVVSKGNGSDVILDFQTGAGGDVVRLHDYNFSNFQAIRSAMTQVGSDVSLDLGGHETLVFRNQTAANFQASNFAATIDTSSAKLVFSDDFNSLSLFNGTSGTWKSTYYWGDRTLSGNGEREFYVDPSYKGLGLNPYSVSDGVLTITAQKATDAVKAQINNLDYTSGLISSEQSFSMQYGYFEMRAELPEGKGLWPAFWLLPVDGKWPPELDVMEVLGNDTNLLHTTVHTNETGDHTSSSSSVAVPDVSEGFHTYGVNWQADKITWYFDGVEVYSAPTPADMHQPMYMIANLAVGGGWPGNPDATTAFPAKMNIDYIRAYELPSDHDANGIPSNWARIDPATGFSTLDATGAKVSWNYSTKMGVNDVKLQLQGSARYAYGNDRDDYIGGSNAAYNELAGGKGNDVLKGNGGIDVFVIKNGDGNDVILDFSNTAGNSDKVRLEGFHFTHFDDVKPWLTKVGADTMLRLDADQAVLFKNLSPDQLKAEQFVFIDSVAAPAGAPPVVSAPASVPPVSLPPVILTPAPTPPVTAPTPPVTPPASSKPPVISQTPEVNEHVINATNVSQVQKAGATTGIDTIHYSGAGAIKLGAGIENVLTTNASANVTGNGLDNRIIVDGTGYARLDGGAGKDDIRGGDFGNDIKGGAGADRLEGGKGVDFLKGGDGDDTFVFHNGDLALTGSRDQIADFQGAGVAGGDVLRFEGFASDAVLHFSGYHQIYEGGKVVGVDQTKQYYDVEDHDGQHGTLLVQIASKALLSDGDYSFA